MARVLLIEDHVDTRELVALVLARAGHFVVEAGDGVAGLERLGATRPDLILLDLTMPVMDGWEFRARQQRLQDQRLAEVPVVLLTAGTNAWSHARALGARGVIGKPVAPEALLRTVAEHAAPEAACLNGNRLSTPPLPPTFSTADRRKARILFVDDDPSALQSYAHALTAEGYDVCTAGDAESGLAELASTTPAVLVLDLHLPAASGLELLRRLRASGYAHLPVAIVTGDYLVEEPAVREIQALGAQIYFKPLWVEDMIQIIHDLTSPGSDGDASTLT